MRAKHAAAMLIWLWGCDEAQTQDPDPEESAGAAAFASCVYVNSFSSTEECKEYRGAAWTEASASSDCMAPMIGADPGTFALATSCTYPSTLGECVIDGGTDDELALIFPGDDAGSCGGVAMGCGFAQGTFVPSAICDETEPVDPPPSAGVFVPFEQVCVEPLAGEPAGASEGQVCTWQAISACTEEGREYTEYASCDPVLTQRPYVPYTITPTTSTDDPRLDDAAWVAELDWVTEQVSSCACVCCHSTEAAPNGPSGWYIEADPIWVDLLDDDGLAMLAGWVDSTAFGAFDAAQNNGFDRSTTGLPTSDIPRMQAFLEGELTRRGLSRADFADTPPFGGFLYDQLFYTPSACANGEGVARDGTVTWVGGAARYLYVLEADANSPGVPPNLDTPDGTLWRLDVSPDAEALASGVAYGTTPAGTTQKVPAGTEALALVPGETYYLVALRDIYQPATRCLFTY
jgi:hypothetical protein